MNWGFLQPELFALVFGGYQIWWIASTIRRQNQSRPLSEGEFPKILGRIWVMEQVTIRGGQTAVRWASSLGADPVRSRANKTGNLRKALCMGGVFAVSCIKVGSFLLVIFPLD